MKSIASPNVTFTGFLSDERLLDLLRKTSVYVQASTHEGFGCSLAEAMLCGCAPVVSDRGAIPEVVGDAGIYVEPHNPRSIGEGIRFAASQPVLGVRARERIVDLFPLEARRKALLATVAEMLE